jgi:hypothetical protein
VLTSDQKGAVAEAAVAHAAIELGIGVSRPFGDERYDLIFSADEVDAFAAYCAEVRRCNFLPFSMVPPGGTIALRLARARNNQRIGVHPAEDAEFAATLGSLKGP